MIGERGLHVMHTIAGLKSSAGGTSNSVATTCSELARAGVEIELVSQEFGSPDDWSLQPEVRAVQARFARAVRLPVLGFVYSTEYRQLVEQTCREKGVQVVHDHGLWLPANHAVASACRKLRMPLIVSTHGMLSQDAVKHQRLKKVLAWHAYQRRDLDSAVAICVTSMQEAEDVRSKGCSQPIAVIPHGVNVQAPRADTASAGTKTALFLGRIHPIKGLLSLVEAWAAVRPVGWQVIVAGPDEDGYRSVVAAAVQQAGLGDTFKFAGAAYGQARDELYAGANLFVLPSFSENFGMAIAEALASGLPVITTKGTPWEVIARQGCGWWVDATVPALASAIREATSIPVGELQAMGSRGHILVRDDFGWSGVVSKLVALYAWALGSGPRPGFVV